MCARNFHCLLRGKKMIGGREVLSLFTVEETEPQKGTLLNSYSKQWNQDSMELQGL